MNNVKDYRDAFVLWIMADANLLVAGGLIANASTFSTPIAVGMIATATTLYTAAAGLLVLSALSVIAGWKVGGDNA